MTDTVFDELVTPDLLVLVQRRACHSEDQDKQDSFYVEGVSQRGADQAETSVGSVWRRGVKEADRRAGDVEVTREGDELPDTGLSQEEASEEWGISKGLKAPRRVTQAVRQEHERTRLREGERTHGTPVENRSRQGVR